MLLRVECFRKPEGEDLRVGRAVSGFLSLKEVSLGAGRMLQKVQGATLLVSATVKPQVGGEGMSLVQAAWGTYEGPTQERWGTGEQSPKFTCTMA